MRSRIIRTVSIIILVIGSLIALNAFFQHREDFMARNDRKLMEAHELAISTFVVSLDKFAALVSGMYTQMNYSNSIPTAEGLRQSILFQLQELGYNESLVVSFLDTNHIFRFSFTESEMDPNKLVGLSATSLRDSEEIKRLDRLMQRDGLVMFEPINLVEGWVGIPLNFRVVRDSVVLGYMAPIIDFKSIIQPIYDRGIGKDFVFRFQTESGIDFDREAVHNGTTIFNPIPDEDFYTNYELEESQFIYESFKCYGLGFNFGIAYKEPPSDQSPFNFTLLVWYATFVLLVVFVSEQFIRISRANTRLASLSLKLEKSRKELLGQKEKLEAMNETKNRLLGMIGHDVKGPIDSLGALIDQLRNRDDLNPELRRVFSSLKEATENASDLLKKVLKWAINQTGGMQINSQRLQLERLTQEEVAHVSVEAQEKAITFENRITEPLVCAGDENMIRAVIRNVLSNAVRFSYNGGRIVIDHTREDGFIKLKIRDFGMGMSPSQVQSINEGRTVTQQKDASNRMGTGLGLELSREFLTLHEGFLFVRSKAKEGTLTVIAIPENQAIGSSN